MLKRDLKSRVSIDSNDTESIDIRDLEELSAAIESDMVVVDEASTVLTTVENQVEVLNNNIDTMSPMEIGRAIGAIETNLDRVTPDTNIIDTESISTVKRDLEAISDSIKKAWEAVKQFFADLWNKIKSYIRKFISWINGTRKVSDDRLDKLINGTDFSKLKKGVTEVDIFNKFGNIFGSIGDGEVTEIYHLDELLMLKLDGNITYSSLEKWLKEDVLNLKYNDITKIIKISNDTISYDIFKYNDKGFYIYQGTSIYTFSDQEKKKAKDRLISSGLLKQTGMMSLRTLLDSLAKNKSLYLDVLEKEFMKIDRMLASNIDNVTISNLIYKNVIWSTSNSDYGTPTEITKLKGDPELSINRSNELRSYIKHINNMLTGFISIESYVYSSLDKIFKIVEESYVSKDYTYDNL